jgi:hypothetical protein
MERFFRAAVEMLLTKLYLPFQYRRISDFIVECRGVALWHLVKMLEQKGSLFDRLSTKVFTFLSSIDVAEQVRAIFSGRNNSVGQLSL